MQHKVKGFTLIELIVVLATFSIIMFGALSLMNPVNKIFVTSSRTENISAASDNIRRYLELNLRYAECVALSNTAPSDEDLVRFVNQHYDGKLVLDENDNLVSASGSMYVIKIDNTNGGKISKTSYTYVAGDSKGEFTTDTSQAYGTTVTQVESRDWEINKAFYDDYHFNISLGLYDLIGDKLEQDPLAVPIDQDNLAFTITAYPYRISSDGTVITDRTFVTETDDDGNTSSFFKYDPGYVFSASMALNNVKDDRSYISYSWVDDGSGTNTKVVEADANGNVKYDVNRTVSTGAPCFSHSDVSEYCEPGEIYIIYTYMGDDIIR